SIFELMSLRRADLFDAIWRHRKVTLHVGSSPIAHAPDAHTAAGGTARQQVGRWDVRTVIELKHHLERIIPGIYIDVAEHLGPGPDVRKAVGEVYTQGNHIIVGMANQFAE